MVGEVVVAVEGGFDGLEFGGGEGFAWGDAGEVVGESRGEVEVFVEAGELLVGREVAEGGGVGGDGLGGEVVRGGGVIEAVEELAPEVIGGDLGGGGVWELAGLAGDVLRFFGEDEVLIWGCVLGFGHGGVGVCVVWVARW